MMLALYPWKAQGGAAAFWPAPADSRGPIAPMPPFTHHIFICSNQRPPGSARPCCDPTGSQTLRKLFKEELRKQGCGRLVRSSHSGCLDQCELGPTIVIYPQAIWYGGVKPEDVPRIVEKTILKGEILENLYIPPEKLNAAAPSGGGA
jgi:(2Fe-2S) ferredoxin